MARKGQKQTNHTDKKTRSHRGTVASQLTRALASMEVSPKKKHHKAPKGQGLYRTGALYTGQGAYKIPKSFQRALGNVAKTALKAGASRAGQMAMDYSGGGSYTSNTNTNELVMGAGSVQGRPTEFHTTRDETGQLVLRGREYIGDVIGPTTAFNVQEIYANPGLPGFCEKAAQVGANFKRYKYKQLIVIFNSTTTDIGSSTTGQVGTVIIASSPNAADMEFAGKRSMMDFKGSVSAKTTDNCVHGIECDEHKTNADWRYVRTAPIPVNQDVKTYDWSLIQIAVANAPPAFANLSLGEIWIEYEIVFDTFYLNSGLGVTNMRDVYVTPSTAALGATANGYNLMGTVGSLYYSNQQNSLGTLLTQGSVGFTITFPSGFEGAITLKILTKPLTTTTNGPLAPPNVTYVGQIAPILDLYDSEGDPTSSATSGYYPVGTAPAGNVSVMTECHYYISPAQSGVNNVITMISTSSALSLVQTWVEVEQYNSFNLLNTGKVGSMVSSTSGSIVGGASI